MKIEINHMIIYGLLALLSSVDSSPMTMLPNPNVYQEMNQDGSVTPFIRLFGNAEPGNDETFEQTIDGYAVEKIDGSYKYLEPSNNGKLTDSGLVAGRDDPTSRPGKSGKKVPKHAKGKRGKKTYLRSEDNEAKVETEELENQKHNGPRPLGKLTLNTGTLKNLVLAFKFSDHAGRTMPSQSDLNILMNNQGPNPLLCPTGSVKDVYLQSSFNQLVLDSTVAAWVTLPNTEAYYANGQSGLGSKMHEAISDALDLVDAAGLIFKDFDADNDGYIDGITIVHSGYGAEWGGTDAYGGYYSNRIWSHKWSLWSLPEGEWTSSDGVRVYDYNISPAVWGTSGSGIGRIGVIAHELGHFLGLPDLYDGSGGSGIGSYSLMANSWGFDGSQLYPPHLDAWGKVALGWLTPTTITASGTYTVRRACDNPDLYRINLSTAPDASEYLLIENRQKCDFDLIPGAGGLAIYHIDESADFSTEGFPGQSGWPTNGNHYRVALLQADGLYNLEKGNNRGDSTDLFSTATANGIGSSGLSTGAAYPNTKAYKNGIIVDLEIGIFDISVSASIMTFAVSFVNNPPTYTPTSPSARPTGRPTRTPSAKPTSSARPTRIPVASPTAKPTATPSAKPTRIPTVSPTRKPTATPSAKPTRKPTTSPSSRPSSSARPTRSARPTANPTAATTGRQNLLKSLKPTTKPTSAVAKLV